MAEATGLVDLSAWPEGTRLILRKERPHPGAQLRFTDIDGNRVTGFLTNTAPGGPYRQLADLELRHRRHARVEDRIRNAKDTGLRNLPFHDTAHNQVWLDICALASDLIAWTQRLALTGQHRIAEPKHLRLRIFSVAARLTRTGRRLTLKIPTDWPPSRRHKRCPCPDDQGPGAPATPATPEKPPAHTTIHHESRSTTVGRDHILTDAKDRG
ncbi:hypothetical protein JOF56_000897 [Kibdelosporangium banguiense]|uniref:Transposase DDE domain-containing protein n=1 Tax=Kibdelosporangium banguiense TaxID=1365924 RepID=A0ABS4T7X7_9PSEU|nr:hypothetical protein [Kibdelosporangium banguiense]